LAELGTPLGRLDIAAVDGVQPHQRIELLPLVALLPVARGAHGAGDGVAATQAVLADQVHRHVDVVGSGQVARGADEGVVVQHVENASDRLQDVVLADLELTALAAAALAVATTTTLAEPASAPAATGLLVLTAAGLVAAALLTLLALLLTAIALLALITVTLVAIALVVAIALIAVAPALTGVALVLRLLRLGVLAAGTGRVTATALPPATTLALFATGVLAALGGSLRLGRLGLRLRLRRGGGLRVRRGVLDLGGVLRGLARRAVGVRGGLALGGLRGGSVVGAL